MRGSGHTAAPWRRCDEVAQDGGPEGASATWADVGADGAPVPGARPAAQLARSWTGASLRGAYILGTGKVPGSSRKRSSSPSSP